MGRKGLKVKVGELKSELGQVKNFELSVGRITDETWDEPIGPTPFPSITDLREWDKKILQRYKPFYMPFCDLCCLCTFGKCDLTGDKRGACGIDDGRTTVQNSFIGLLHRSGYTRKPRQTSA